MKTYMIPFLLASLFLAQTPAPAAVHIEAGPNTQIAAQEAGIPQFVEKDAWPNTASWAVSLLSLGPFFLGGMMFICEGLFYFLTGYSLLAIAQIMVFVAIGLALGGVILGLVGRKRPKAEKGQIGIILGLFILVLSALLLIL